MAASSHPGGCCWTRAFSSSLHDCPAELSFTAFKSLLNNCVGGRAQPLPRFLDAGSSLWLLLFTLPFMRCQHCRWFICCISGPFSRPYFPVRVFCTDLHRLGCGASLWSRDWNGHTTGLSLLAASGAVLWHMYAPEVWLLGRRRTARRSSRCRLFLSSPGVVVESKQAGSPVTFSG